MNMSLSHCAVDQTAVAFYRPHAAEEVSWFYIQRISEVCPPQQVRSTAEVQCALGCAVCSVNVCVCECCMLGIRVCIPTAKNVLPRGISFERLELLCRHCNHCVTVAIK